MIEIWGRKNSSNVVPVMWAIGELGLVHERHNAGGSFGGLDTDEYVAMNPNRLVPTMRDHGFALWESQAIIRYLAAKYGQGTLMPETPKAAATADQWMEWSSGTAIPSYFPVFWGLVRTQPEDRDMDAIRAAAVRAGEIWQRADDRLAATAYLGGDSFTMADIPLGAATYRYFNLDIERPSFPNIEAWYERLCERPAYQEHVMNPFGSNPDEWAACEKKMHGLT